MAERFEYLPLLSPGFHDIKIEELEDVFLKPFEEQERRREIISKFKLLLIEIEKVGINFEVWINGSFATQNPKPNDVDLVFFANIADINGLGNAEMELLQRIFVTEHEQTKDRYKCDIYIAFNEDSERRSYWRGWFCFTREEKPKGVARIYVMVNQ